MKKWGFFLVLLLSSCSPAPFETGELVCPSGDLPPCQAVQLPLEVEKECKLESAKTLEDFSLIQPGMSLTEVCATIGRPQWISGSGISIYIYPLEDGDAVWLGYADPDRLLYALHIRSTDDVADLFEKK